MESIYPYPQATEFDDEYGFPLLNSYSPPAIEKIEFLKKSTKQIEDVQVSEKINESIDEIEAEILEKMARSYFLGMQDAHWNKATVHYVHDFSNKYLYAIFPSSYSKEQKVAWLLDKKIDIKNIRDMMGSYMLPKQWKEYIKNIEIQLETDKLKANSDLTTKIAKTNKL